MISIVRQGDSRYQVYRSGHNIGSVAVSENPYHDQHRHLNLGLDQYDPATAKELFSLLRRELGRPLQVMLYSTQEMHDFLTAGGFARKRRCCEIAVTSADLIAPVQPTVELQTVRKGYSSLYSDCCELLYTYYSAAHEAVSPLTAPPDLFCAGLPETVVCRTADGKPVHYAFVAPEKDGYEIAYVGTTAPPDFRGFARSLIWTLFQKCDLLTMECDDTDPAAMEVKSLFRVSNTAPYDTYILE